MLRRLIKNGWHVPLKPTHLLLLLSTLAFGDESDLSVYTHWRTNEYEKVTAQPWRNASDVISGWDWSLPNGIKASPLAFVAMHENPHSGIPCRSLDQIRFTWRELEPEEGKCDFETAKKKIADSIAKGYGGVVLRIWGSVWDVVSYPDASIPLTKWPGGTMAAPRWLRNGTNQVPLISMKPTKEGWQIRNCDIMDAGYHEKYKRFIKALGDSGIPAMPEVAIVNLTYRSHSMGEEFTEHQPGESTATPEEINQRTYERLDAWAQAFGENRRKLMWVDDANHDWPPGASYNDHAQSLGIGERNGFIEMYNAWCQRPGMGQTIGADRHLVVDEENPYIKNGVAFGDENEEYVRSTRNLNLFGKYETFGYRYMISTLMMLKMRRNYAMLWTTTLNPELLHWMGLELGRKVTDTPDVWCWLNECYQSDFAKNAGPIKNIERWLLQRDEPGYETEPFLAVPLTKNLWYNDSSKPYDYVSRRGRKIGFAVDDRFLNATSQKVAIKVTFYDGVAGSLSIVYSDNLGMQKVSCQASGSDTFKTATFFVTATCPGKGTNFDFEIQSEERVPINFVRVVKL